MKRILLIFTASLFVFSCNQPTNDCNCEFGYTIWGEDSRDTLVPGDLTHQEIWDKYIEAHNERDVETIAMMDSDTIKIWGPRGEYIEGKEAHIEFLNQWFKDADPKWSTFFSMPSKTKGNAEKDAGWVTSGSIVNMKVDEQEIRVNQAIDAYISDGLIQRFFVYERAEVPESE
tara:strand:- start:378 stop:896 length:519 start_codon:yes stop_codon:yes gene_type:complete